MLGCAVLLAAGPARAQGPYGGPPQEHLLRIGVGGGVIVPTANARTALKQGVHAQAFALVNLIPSLPLRFNLGYQRFNLKQAALAGQSGQGTSSGTSQILGGVGGFQLNLLNGPVRPYVTAGVGGFDVRSAVDGAASTSAFKFGVDGGAGLALRLGRLSAFIEGRVQNVYTNQGATDLKSIQAVPVSFGVIF